LPPEVPASVSLNGIGSKRGVCHLLDAHCGVCQGFFWATVSCSETERVLSINIGTGLQTVWYYNLADISA
jgi:hypothetical protein